MSGLPDTPWADLRQVTVRYGRVPALEQVTLRITPGERVALVGANGSGKSTLLRTLHGLLPLTAGTRQAPGRHRVAMLFQRPHMLRTSAQNNVALALWLRGTRWRDARLQALTALQRYRLVGLVRVVVRIVAGRGGSVDIDASASSQFVSGLLLSAARFDEGLTLRHTGRSLPSLPHIAMTLHMLGEHGVDVDFDADASTWRLGPSPIAALDRSIEPDLSNALPFLAAAVVAGGISADRYVHRTETKGLGWWSGAVGVRAPIDLTRFRVLAFDFAPDFGPDAKDAKPPLTITTQDQARLLALVLNHLKIERVAAFVGCSYGGMVGLAGVLAVGTALKVWVLNSQIVHPLKQVLAQAQNVAAGQAGQNLHPQTRPQRQFGGRALGEGAALLAQDVQRAVDGSIVHFGRNLLHFSGGQVFDLHFGVHLEDGVKSQLAFGRFFLFGDLGLTGDAQLGFVGGGGKGLAHLVVHDLVVHRITIALGHHVHGDLARTEAVHLDIAGQALEALGHFALDHFGRQCQRDLALELFQGFNGHGHGVSPKGWWSASQTGRASKMSSSMVWRAEVHRDREGIRRLAVTPAHTTGKAREQ